jgi:hypothetical protein
MGNGSIGDLEYSHVLRVGLAIVSLVLLATEIGLTKACSGRLAPFSAVIPDARERAFGPAPRNDDCDSSTALARPSCLPPGLGALVAAIGAAGPMARERAIRIDGHGQDHGSALAQARHRQHVADDLTDAGLLAVVS